MAFNIKKVKGFVSSFFKVSVDLLVSFIYLSLYVVVIFGAMSSFMLLVYLFPDKSSVISKPFLLLFQILWNFIKITFMIAFCLMLAYGFLVFYDLLERAREKRNERRKKFILDLAKEIKSREKKK